ncbi:MAG: EAL domain-containing protein [Alphaproteobacteria bacterium]
MSIGRHILIFSAYTALALLVMALLPAIAHDVSAGAGVLTGAVLFLAGALAHEAMARRHGEAQALQRLVVLRKAYNQNRDDLQRARDEIRRVYEMMEAVNENPTVGAAAPELQEVASEVKVLHSLVEQLYSTEGGMPPGPAPAPAPAAPSALAAPQSGRSEPTLVRRVEPAQPAQPPGPDAALLAMVRDALRQNRVELYLQPIVSLPQRKRRYYECFSRVHAGDGKVIMPGKYLDVARKANLLSAIDNMLLFRCVQLVRKTQQHDYSTAFFCNLSANSLGDRRFLRDFAEYLQSCEDMAPSLVFEFAQRDVTMQPEEATADLERLRKVGYRFCMDQVTNLSFDAERLAAQGFRFIKIDAAALLGRPGDDAAANAFRLLKQTLDRLGIDLIVQKIETEQMLDELMEFNIDFGQGYLFGEPRIAREPGAAPLTATATRF